LPVNRQIQTAALVYCKDAKEAFHKMTNSVEMLSAVRQELTLFLTSSASSESAAGPLGTDAACGGAGAAGAAAVEARSCFGCSSRLVMHALVLAERLVQQRPSCRQLVMREGLLAALIGGIMHTGSAASKRQARAVTCLLVRDDAALTGMMLQQGIVAKVDACLQHRSALDLEAALREEMLLLNDACRQPDSCWEQKYKTLLQLLFKAAHDGASEQTAVASGIILPVLQILAHLCCRPAQSARGNGAGAAAGVPAVTYAEWQAGAASYEHWKARPLASPAQQRVLYLERKFGKRWLRRWRGGGGGQRVDLLSETWVRKLLLNRCSQAVRSTSKAVLAATARASAYRAVVVVDLLAGMLGLAANEHSNSSELFELFTELVNDESHRLFLAARGFLPILCGLVTAEVARIRQVRQERPTCRAHLPWLSAPGLKC
jgi:hypothetical protein